MKPVKKVRVMGRDINRCCDSAGSRATKPGQLAESRLVDNT